jgi:DNA-binding FrmR family transcriptional regulator
MPKNQAPIRGYTASKDQLLGRLKRIEGQIRRIEGTEEMMAAVGRLLRRG